MAKQKGGKLTRSEVVPVRFDPKLKWACELLAAKERRTLSSLIEWVMEKAVKEMAVTIDEGQPVTAWQVASKGWAEEEVSRIWRLALSYPELLTHAEGRIASALSLLNWFETSCMMLTSNIDFFQVIAKRIWPTVLTFAEGEIEQEELFRVYREARIDFWKKTETAGSQELRTLAASGALDSYPEAKKLLSKLVGPE